MFPGDYPGPLTFPGDGSNIPTGFRLYRTPTYQAQPADPRGERLWLYFGITQGLSVLKNGSTYVVTINPTDLESEEADFFYQGGHEYIVTDSEYAALTAAGLTPESNPSDPTDPTPPLDPIIPAESGYGSGAYGSGPYGV